MFALANDGKTLINNQGYTVENKKKNRPTLKLVIPREEIVLLSVAWPCDTF